MASTETRRYDFTLAAYGTQILHASGRRFVVKSSTGAVKINTNTGDSLQGIEAGQGLAMADGQQFSRLEITDMTGAANAGFIIISDDSFIDGRVTGEVSVIDGERSRTVAGGRLMAGVGFQPANFPQIQLWNPSTDRNLVVTGLEFSTSVAASVNVFGNAVALATDVTAVRSGNALIGAAVGVGQIRTENKTGVSGYGNLFSIDAVASTPYKLKLSGPIVVPPGTGINVIAQLNAAGLSVNLEWYEQAVL